MKAEEVYRSVERAVANHDHRFRNTYVHGWEADHFSVTSSLYSYEFEVKVSRSDFFADFQKPKHKIFRRYKKGNAVIPLHTSWKTEGWPITDQFPELKDFKIEFTNIESLKIGQATCPNRFFFAVPHGLVRSSEVPEYAGLIYCSPDAGSHVVRQAPLLHKEPLNVKIMLFQKYVNFHIQHHRDNIWLKDQHKIDTQLITNLQRQNRELEVEREELAKLCRSLSKLVPA